MEHFGRVLSVMEEHKGGTLTQDESGGATTLHLDDVEWASDDGGDVFLKKGKEVKTYDSVNGVASTIHLTSGLSQSYPEGARVEPWNPDSRTRWAEVHIEGTEYEDAAAPVIAHIPGHLVNVIPVGTRRGWHEKVLVRRDERWRLFVARLEGLHGDMVTWLYQTNPDISQQSGWWFEAPYDATMVQVRLQVGNEGSSQTNANVYDDQDNPITVKDMIIPGSKRKSEWVKLGGDDGYFIQDNERFYCWVDTIGTDVEGPAHFYIRVLPKGQA